jgi:hypothetical protein
MPITDRDRIAAAMALHIAKADEDRALVEFRKLAPRSNVSHVRQWLHRVNKGTARKCFPKPTKRTKHRSSKVSDARAKKAASILMAGYSTGGFHRQYTSFAEVRKC